MDNQNHELKGMKNRILEEAELTTLLQELCSWEALEVDLSEKESAGIVRIPYLMNDAAEYFIAFYNCNVKGQWIEEDEEAQGEMLVASVSSEERKGIVIRQKSGNTITIWYEKAYKSLQCYQYHLIGHSWRKKPGEEDIRRIVNLLCVLHDKYSYLGEAACSEEELFLYRLAEFHPLLYYTPIDHSIRSWYPDTEKGCQAMLKIAEDVSDNSFIQLLRKYEAEHKKGKITEKKIQKLALELGKEKHNKLIENIEKRINAASSGWPERDYGEEKNKEIQEIRQNIIRKYEEQGFQGSYPYFEKQEADKKIRLQFAEEHPFTVMESSDYAFRIYSLTGTENDRSTIKLNREIPPLHSRS